MMPTTAQLVLPLTSADASLAVVGGKGRSLARLAAAGLPVPDGFLLSTQAYKEFVAANGLQESILDCVGRVKRQDAASIELASSKIHASFEAATLPTQIASPVAQAYAALGKDDPAVAVRSSATAEDLPDLSFAGQQDTYLNVRGEAPLLDAIRRCWASLWTARAIAYRQQMKIDQRAVAMGVVVQLMIPADVSGILFTANPSSGERSELVVNASYGLGEAVVSGLVTPDTYVLDRTSLEPKETVIGGKGEMIVAVGAGGTTTQPVPDAKRSEASLSSDALRELATHSLQVEQLFGGVPQDIEWAFARAQCWLLQSRPITNLPAPPLRDVSWDPPYKGAKLVRRQVVENMPEPLSPLFAELYLDVGLEESIDRMLEELGVGIKIEDVMVRPWVVTVNGYAYCRADHRTWRLLRVIPKALFWYVTSLRSMLKNAVPNWRDKGLPGYMAAIEQWKAVDPAGASDEELLAGVRALAVADANYWFDAAIVLGVARITDALLNRFLTSRFVRGDLTSGLFLRGFASKTIESQEMLEAIAGRIRADTVLRDTVLDTSADELLDALAHQPAGESLREEIDEYLEQYGHQIYTLDFAVPTQLADPKPVLLSLRTLVQNADYDTAARQAQLAQECDARVQETLKSLGPLRRWMFRKFLRWAQNYGPYREEALFYMGAAWPTLRNLALELGARLVEAGTLRTPDDVFYLSSAEIVEAYTARKENRACPDLAGKAKQRRLLRESRKRLQPPSMVPVGSRFKFGPIDFETQKRNVNDSDMLKGFAVSPGKVTGPASVILSPGDFEKMRPDTILVCPTTTPAWTPLFAQASGLATDIGGILAHGSIVAREYGIPAVLGTGNITQRIENGQRITVDGDAGTVTIEE